MAASAGGSLPSNLVPEGATELDLMGAQLGAEGGIALAETLCRSSVLASLDLYGTGIGTTGGIAIAEALCHNSSLTSLNLSGNLLGPEGGRAIAEALCHNTTLCTLHLSRNELGTEGGAAIAEALRQNCALTSLNVSSNELNAEVGNKLQAALRQNVTLTELDIAKNDIPEDIWQEIEALLRTAPARKRRAEEESDERRQRQQHQEQTKQKRNRSWKPEVLSQALAKLQHLRRLRRAFIQSEDLRCTLLQQVANKLPSSLYVVLEEDGPIVQAQAAKETLEAIQQEIRDGNAWPRDEVLRRRQQARRDLIEAIVAVEERWKDQNMVALRETCVDLIQKLRQNLHSAETSEGRKRKAREEDEKESEKENEERGSGRREEWEHLAIRQDTVRKQMMGMKEETEAQVKKVIEAFHRVAWSFAEECQEDPTEEQVWAYNYVDDLTATIDREKEFLQRSSSPTTSSLSIKQAIRHLQSLCTRMQQANALITDLTREKLLLRYILRHPPDESRLLELRKVAKRTERNMRIAQVEVETAENEREKSRAAAVLDAAKKHWREQGRLLEHEALRLVAASNNHSPELRFKLQHLELGSVDLLAVDCPFRRLEHYDRLQVLQTSSSGASSRHCIMLGTFNDKQCVLKEFDLSNLGDRQHFVRELKRLRQLRHEHVVEVEAAFVQEDPSGRSKGYIQMPFYTGGNLCQWLQKRRIPLSDAEKQRVGRGVMLALQHIHSKGIVHRDLKPENVFIDDEERAILGDFDISFNVGGVTNATNIGSGGESGGGGTWSYMAPEMATNNPTPAADVFAWGLLMFDLHFAPEGLNEGGRAAAPRPTFMEMVRGQAVTVPQHPDLQLVDLLQQTLHLNPKQRPTAAQCLSHPYMWSNLHATRVGLKDLRKCLVCMEDDWVDEGLECCGEQTTNRHFACPECLDGYVVSLLDVPVAKLVTEKETDDKERGRRTSHVPCMVTGCRADPFPMELLMAHVKDSGRKALMALRCKVEEFLLERGFEDRLKAERQMWEEESSTQKHRRYIIEHILTLQCPRCQQAFVDFDGCFALECSRCNAALCGWCLQDCGTDAHKHVRACPFSFLEGVKGYFGTFEMFKEAQRRRQVRWLEEYVGRLPPAEQEQVVASLQQELNDLGIVQSRT